MTQTDIFADWIGVACDGAARWGWAVRGGTVLRADTWHSQDTKTALIPDALTADLAHRFASQIGPGPLPVILSGTGLDALPAQSFAAVPARPGAQALIALRSGNAQFDIHAVPGLVQATPPGLMHGDETRIAGFLVLNPGWDGVLCLTGSQTCWAQISAGEVVSFQGTMTPQLINLVTSTPSVTWDDTPFLEALADGLSHPERLAARLASLKAEALMRPLAPEIMQARVTGLMVGADLAAARAYWLGQNLALIGTDATIRPYLLALQDQGATPTATDGPRAALAGLTAQWRKLTG